MFRIHSDQNKHESRLTSGDMVIVVDGTVVANAGAVGLSAAATAAVLTAAASDVAASQPVEPW
jgi:hypothetical protein